jgi:hypothetical protein
MTQKQIAEAVHLKHFSDQRLEREARIRQRCAAALLPCMRIHSTFPSTCLLGLAPVPRPITQRTR